MADLVINNFHKGVAQSPHLGFQEFHNMDISTVLGTVKPSFALAKESASIVTGSLPITNIVSDTNSATLYGCTAAGVIYTSSDLGDSWSALTTTNYTARALTNIIVWKGFLVAAGITSNQVYLQFYSIGGGAWQTGGSLPLTSSTDANASGNNVSLKVGQDDILYAGNGRYIDRLKEIGTFDPTNSATYLLTAGALTLPFGYKVKFMEELGKDLYVGTTTETGSVGASSLANIFPWDKVSNTFNLPIILNDFAAHAAVTSGKVMYFMTGNRGRLWKTNGVEAVEVAKLPLKAFKFDTAPDGKIEILQNALSVKGNKILIGVGGIGNTDAYPLGVWSYNLNTGALNLEYEISADRDTTPNIGAVYYDGLGRVMVGWADGTNAGIDMASVTSVYTSNAYGISKFYHVGKKYQKRTFKRLHVLLGKDLASGDSVTVSYRESLSDSWTQLQDITFATYGADHVFDIPIINLNVPSIQIKFELTTSGTSIPELREIRLE